MTCPLTIAVCGASGRIGRSVVRELTARGHQVVNLDRRPTPDLPGRSVEIELADRVEVRRAFEGMDVVIHLAETPNVNTALPAEEVYRRNVGVGAIVMQAAADLKIPRLIYASSCQVYGCWDSPNVAPLRLPFDETHPVRPQNAYALGKVVNEEYARWLSQQQGASIAIFRLPWVVSFDPDEEFWRRLETQSGFIDALGTYVHHTDAARAFALAAESSLPGCEIYHFSAAEILSAQPLRERLRSNPGYPALPEDWPDYASPVLTGKARSHLGWKPLVNLRELSRRWRAGHAR